MAGGQQHQVEAAGEGRHDGAPGGGIGRVDHRQAGEGHPGLGGGGQAQVGVADDGRPGAGGGGLGDQGEGQRAGTRTGHPDGAPPLQPVGQQAGQGRGHRQGALGGRWAGPGAAGRLAEGAGTATGGRCRDGGGPVGRDLVRRQVVERLGVGQQAGGEGASQHTPSIEHMFDTGKRWSAGNQQQSRHRVHDHGCQHRILAA